MSSKARLLVPRIRREQQLQIHRVRKFRRLPEAAVRAVEHPRELIHRAADQIERQRLGIAAALARADFLNLRRELIRRRDRLLAAILPGVDHRRENLIEPRHAVPARRRPIRAAIKRLQLRRQKHAHRPAAAAREHLHRVHVNLIEVRPLLAVDLDRHEMLVEHARRSPRSQNSRAPSHGTSDRPSSRSTERSASPRGGPFRSPPRPTDTSPPDCSGAGAGTGLDSLGQSDWA